MGTRDDTLVIGEADLRGDGAAAMQRGARHGDGHEPGIR